MKNIFYGLVLLLLIGSQVLAEPARKKEMSKSFRVNTNKCDSVILADFGRWIAENKEANQTIAEELTASPTNRRSTPYYQKLVETDPTFEKYYPTGIEL